MSLRFATIWVLAVPLLVLASSHREAPHTLELPKTDGTDFYMFRSYEPGREDYVTIVANYNPLQPAYGGPNYFILDENAIYEIHIDNNGDAEEDITFQFSFLNRLIENFTLQVGGEGNAVANNIPLVQIGQLSADAIPNNGVLQVEESYTLDVILGDRRHGDRVSVTHAESGADRFLKPADNFGQKSIPDYPAYAAAHVYPIRLGEGMEGRLFVGQRQEGFVFNIGKGFDLVNTNPLGPVDGESSALQAVNITSLILEIPIAYLTREGEPVIGAWTSSSKRQNRVLLPNGEAANTPLAEPAQGQTSFSNPDVEFGRWHQVSRLGSPLVNEIVIGLPDKNLFNFSHPRDDAQFADYVTHPVFPELLEILFGEAGAVAPNLFPRADLIQVFLTGVPGLNQPVNGVAAEMLRLNTAIDPTPLADQNPLGVVGGDLAGYPNGRRPGDDVIDIALRAVMGVLLDETSAPTGQLPFTDGAYIDATFFSGSFPYLNVPIPGSDQ